MSDFNSRYSLMTFGRISSDRLGRTLYFPFGVFSRPIVIGDDARLRKKLEYAAWGVFVGAIVLSSDDIMGSLIGIAATIHLVAHIFWLWTEFRDLPRLSNEDGISILAERAQVGHSRFQIFAATFAFVFGLLWMWAPSDFHFFGVFSLIVIALYIVHQLRILRRKRQGQHEIADSPVLDESPVTGEPNWDDGLRRTW